MVVDTTTGQRRSLLSEAGHDFSAPRISPDGRLVAAIRERHDSYEEPGDVTLVVTALDGSRQPRDLLSGFDRRPTAAAWAADSDAVYFTADDRGRRPVFRADLATGQVARLTADDGAYDSLCPAPDGRYLYAIRAAVDEPQAPVRLDTATAGSPPVRLVGPGPPLELPGRLTEIETSAGDGVRIRAWLVLPETAAAAGEGAAAAVGARRPAVQLEHLVVAVEPVADGRPRVTRCCCRIRRCRPDMVMTSSPAGTASGAASRTGT